MKKLFFLLLVIFSTSAFAQKVEHGVLVGGGIGFPMQDSKQLPERKRDDRVPLTLPAPAETLLRPRPYHRIPRYEHTKIRAVPF